MNTRVVYVLCGQRNQLCNPTICFATSSYAYAHPITQSIYVYVCAYVYLPRTQHLLPGVVRHILLREKVVWWKWYIVNGRFFLMLSKIPDTEIWNGSTKV